LITLISHYLAHISLILPPLSNFFFFTTTATTEIYTLSLHDALPIFYPGQVRPLRRGAHPAGDEVIPRKLVGNPTLRSRVLAGRRSEEHTSELQSRSDLVCRLLLEKKKKRTNR